VGIAFSRFDVTKTETAPLLRFWNSDVSANLSGVLEIIAATIAELRAKKIPTRSPSLRWRSAPATDLPFSRGGKERRARPQEIQ